MNNFNIFNMLQFAGGTFPGGGFSQSWGLETYVEKGVVKDIQTLNEFLLTYTDSILAKSEGPIVVSVMDFYRNDDHEKIKELEALSVASKLTKESREASLRMGNAFMRISSNSLNDKNITETYNKFKENGITYSVAYGLVMENLGVSGEEALSAYIFNSVNAVVQSAVKLIPLGNSEAQAAIIKMQSTMDRAVDTALSLPYSEIITFCPGLDIAGMEHEILPVRLYMT